MTGVCVLKLDRPEYKAQLQNLQAMCPWARDLTFLTFNFHTFNM